MTVVSVLNLEEPGDRSVRSTTHDGVPLGLEESVGEGHLVEVRKRLPKRPPTSN